MVCRCTGVAAYLLSVVAIPTAVFAQSQANPPTATGKQATTDKKTASKQSTGKALTPAEELQKAINEAGNDRAALVKNLQNYLEKYPDAPERPQIYRALVEACMQFHDDR